MKNNTFARFERALFQFCTFRRHSRAINDVKCPFLQLCGRREHLTTNVDSTSRFHFSLSFKMSLRAKNPQPPAQTAASGLQFRRDIRERAKYTCPREKDTRCEESVELSAPPSHLVTSTCCVLFLLTDAEITIYRTDVRFPTYLATRLSLVPWYNSRSHCSKVLPHCLSISSV